jgi:ribonuclease HI
MAESDEYVYLLDSMVAFTDGASNPHVKRSGIGIAFYYTDQLTYPYKGETLKPNQKPCCVIAEEIKVNRFGVKFPTNNDAEYLSLIRAMEFSIDANVKKLNVFMDSKLVVCQVDNKWKINHDHLRNYKKQVDELRKKITMNVYHVKREYNEYADYYSKLAIDQNTKFMDNKYAI